MTNKQLEEKLDRIIELLEKLTAPSMDFSVTYPTAPHELEANITYYPWQPHETSSSL